MAERTFIPSSPACGQWETLLADALDGLLKPEDEVTFNAHKAVCPACSALYEEARKGREWLEFLSPEPEVPAGLLARILAVTGPRQTLGYGLATAGGNVLPIHPASIPAPAWQRPGMMAHLRRFAEPRLMLTAAMAFFSIAMTLGLTGIRFSSLRLSELRPGSFPSQARSFLERRFTMASTPIIRYYDHSRLVYEVQTRMRELRRTTQGQGEGQSGDLKQNAPSGETNQTPARKDGGTWADPSQQPVTPAAEPTFTDSDFLENSLAFLHRPVHSGGSPGEIWERSIVWIA
jgi:hypothetical protein